MGRHLAASGTGIARGSNSLEQHVFRRHPKSERQTAIAVIRKDPVVPGPGDESCGDLNRLVACRTDLEEDLVLPLEQDFAVVQAARKIHEAEGLKQSLTGEPAGETMSRSRYT